MSYYVRIQRPECPILLLREPEARAGYAIAFRRSDATEYPTLEHARAVVRQLIDASAESKDTQPQVALCFKRMVLAYEPWTDSSGSVDHTAPEDWATRAITGAQISILTSRMKTVETFPFELAK